MEVSRLVKLLDQSEVGYETLAGWKLQQPAAAHANLLSLAQSGVTLDLLASLCRRLETYLPQAEDPDRLLAELRRYFESSRSPLALASLLDRDETAARMLLQVLDLGRAWADVLVADPEAFDLLRVTEGQPAEAECLAPDLDQELVAGNLEEEVQQTLNRFRNREWLRIAYGQIYGQLTSEVVGEQLAAASQAMIRAALAAAERHLVAQNSNRTNGDPEPNRVGILGLGRLGGRALSYHDALEIMFLADLSGFAASKPGQAGEIPERTARQVVQWLDQQTNNGDKRVIIHALPAEGVIHYVAGVEQALYYYDVLGRTWQRREFLSARPIAGNEELCERFLKSLESWLYRRYLHRADETGIKALQRRLLRRLERDANEELSLAVVSRAAFLIEDVVQFLQLLSGGELTEIHSGQTLVALQALGKAGVLDPEETATLEQAYRTFRAVEQLGEVLAGPTPRAPTPVAWSRVNHWALRADVVPADSSLDNHLGEIRLHLGQVIKRLIGGMFQQEPPVLPITDLILEPDPRHANPVEVLAPLGFQDPEEGYANLQALATEKIPFLSTRRCRHFLASIAPQLVEAIAATPSPDTTLSELSQVSESLGGKGVLWELFSFHRPSLELYVRLCAASPYLSGILTSNPGMIDELLDSLMLDRLPELPQLERLLDSLCRGTADSSAMLIGFKQSQHLRIGIRDLLGKDDIVATHRALADVAEACLGRVVRTQRERLATKFGEPTTEEAGGASQPCEFLMVALGKLGGREPNYHSDTEVIFVYESDGLTRLPERSRRDTTTTNAHFFNQLAQKVVNAVTQLGPQGRLYELGTNHRPHGKLGPLAISADEFFRFLSGDNRRVVECQTMLKARPITGSLAARTRFTTRLREMLSQLALPVDWQGEMYRLRRASEEGASERNLKRGPGGTMDLECVVQTLQLENRHLIHILEPGTLPAIGELRRAGIVSPLEASYLQESYQYLRRVESAIRLMNRIARHDLPDDVAGQGRLAMLLREPHADRVLTACDHYRRENRRLFERFFAERGISSASA